MEALWVAHESSAVNSIYAGTAGHTSSCLQPIIMLMFNEVYAALYVPASRCRGKRNITRAWSVLFVTQRCACIQSCRAIFGLPAGGWCDAEMASATWVMLITHGSCAMTWYSRQGLHVSRTRASRHAQSDVGYVGRKHSPLIYRRSW